MNDIYDNVSDIHIVTEGYQSGYIVKINDAHSYRVSRDEIEHLVEKLYDVVSRKGNITNWEFSK